MSSRKTFLALITAAMIAAPLAAQTLPVRVPRTNDTSLQQYGRSIEGETASLRAAGLGRDWDRIRPLVERYLQPQTYPYGPDKHAILRAYHVASTTNFLVRIGYRARHLAHSAQARTLVRAANIVSWEDPDALVLVSPTVFVADLVRIDRKADNSADLVYRVREPIKSAPAKGREFRYPLNGPFPTAVATPGGPPPPPPPPNPAAWELARAKAVLFLRAPSGIGNFFGPMPVDGERVLPGYHSGTRETTLAAVRAAARAQLCSPGYVPVVRGIHLPHRCSGLIATAAISLADILGQWDVVSFEGYEPVRMKGATRAAIADFGEQGVQLRIECNTSSSTGTIGVLNGRLVRGAGARMQTEMGCAKEREERDRRYFSLFDRSPSVERLPNGRLRLVAGESVLILERPEQRRLAYVPARSELDGEWRMEELIRYGQNGGYSGIGLSDVPGRIVIEGHRLSYDRCPRYDLTYSYSSDGRLMKTGGALVPQEPKCPTLRYPDYEAPALPSAMEILPLLHSNPWVEDVGNGQLLIANERVGLLLTKRSERR